MEGFIGKWVSDAVRIDGRIMDTESAKRVLGYEDDEEMVKMTVEFSADGIMTITTSVFDEVETLRQKWWVNRADGSIHYQSCDDLFASEGDYEDQESADAMNRRNTLNFEDGCLFLDMLYYEIVLKKVD